MRQIKNKHRKRTHLLVNVVLRTTVCQYTARQMGPNKIETICWLSRKRRGRIRCYRDWKNNRAIIVWLDGRYYSAPNTQGIYLERISMNMAEYKRLNSH
nr:MAG TPA: hypothetical protein [Caudoviricetes sp.]